MKNNECGGTHRMQGMVRNAYKILVGKSERKEPVKKLEHLCENNIRTDHKGLGRGVHGLTGGRGSKAI
jgi:hypothetical protein